MSKKLLTKIIPFVESSNSLSNFKVLFASRYASDSSNIKNGDLDDTASAYCNANDAIDFSPPESCYKS